MTSPGFADVKIEAKSNRELENLAPLENAIADISIFRKEIWRNIEAYTEGGYVEQALQRPEGDDGVGQLPIAAEHSVRFTVGAKWSVTPGKLPGIAAILGAFGKRETHPEHMKVVSRSNLDVYSGTAGNYGHFHGNLREAEAEVVFRPTLEHGAVSDEEVHFATSRMPTVSELAAKVGAKEGTRICFTTVEMRQRWLDVALADYRRY